MDKVGHNLHRTPNHPICTIKNIIFDHFSKNHKDAAANAPLFHTYDNFSPIVTVKQNFDDLLSPPDHPSRSLSDTFYVDHGHVLRPHTSAHQTHLLREGKRAFLVAGDCYRRDEIDASHYPVFHQMEGVKVFDPKALPEDPAKGMDAGWNVSCHLSIDVL